MNDRTSQMMQSIARAAAAERQDGLSLLREVEKIDRTPGLIRVEMTVRTNTDGYIEIAAEKLAYAIMEMADAVGAIEE